MSISLSIVLGSYLTCTYSQEMHVRSECPFPVLPGTNTAYLCTTFLQYVHDVITKGAMLLSFLNLEDRALFSSTNCQDI